MANLKSAFSAGRVILGKGLVLAGKGLALARRELVPRALVAWKYARIWGARAGVVLSRSPIAIYSFARALASAEYAETLRTGLVTGGSAPRAVALQPPTLQRTLPESALVLLSLLQKEGRLLDFLQENITGYGDAEIGAAARVVHEGCGRVMREHIRVAPVLDQAEGSQITLERGFDPVAIRPSGHVVGEPPFRGTLTHRGWRAVEVRLPQVAEGHDVHILAAAEVEL